MKDKKLEQLLNDLRSLRKVEAPDNFEFNLQTRLKNQIFNSVELDDEYHSSSKSLRKFTPALAFVSLAVLIFTILQLFTEVQEDPLQIQPQIREDIIAYSEGKNKAPISELLNDSFIYGDSNVERSLSRQNDDTQKESHISNERARKLNQYQFSISKEELNFIRPVMSDEEIKQVQHLKQKLISRKN
jgi:hypothetical protein